MRGEAPTLLVTGAGAEAAAGIAIAKRLGVHVVASDRDPSAPGFSLADDRLLASTYDVDQTLEAALDYHRRVRRIDAVLCIASDVPRTVAHVAAALGLPGISVESAELASDKLAMKDRLGHDGVPIPWYAPVSGPDELARLVGRYGCPLVLKPVDSRGARGVLRITPGVDLGHAWETARAFSPTDRVMLERFLDGPQLSTESLVVAGVAHTVGMSDRNYALLERFAPHIIEDGGALPTHLDAPARQRVCALVQRAATSLGIRDGVVKGDIVIHRGQPHLIEMAARLSGGRFCTHEIPLSTGVDFVAHAIRLALGQRPDPHALEPRFERGVAQRYVFPTPGRVVAVEGVEAAASLPGIAFCDVRARPGDRVGPIHHHPARAGSLIAVAEGRDEAIQRAELAVQGIRVTTRPEAEPRTRPAVEGLSSPIV